MLVDLGVLIVILEVDVRLDDVVHIHAGHLQDLANLAQAVLDLAGGVFLGLVIPFAGDVQRFSDHDARRKEAGGSFAVLGDKFLDGSLGPCLLHQAQDEQKQVQQEIDQVSSWFHHLGAEYTRRRNTHWLGV